MSAEKGSPPLSLFPGFERTIAQQQEATEETRVEAERKSAADLQRRREEEAILKGSPLLPLLKEAVTLLREKANQKDADLYVTDPERAGSNRQIEARLIWGIFGPGDGGYYMWYEVNVTIRRNRKGEVNGLQYNRMRSGLPKLTSSLTKDKVIKALDNALQRPLEIQFSDHQPPLKGFENLCTPPTEQP